MLRYEVRHNEPLDKALRKFKRLCERAGILREAKRMRSFEKPSDKQRRERMKRLSKIRKASLPE